ncbi:hypothetical protein C8R47DRAFT_1139894, partial [Mycena vitilis]
MARFLAGLDFPADFELGPEQILPQGNIVQYYCEKPTGKVLRTLLVGTLTAIIERKNEPKVMILSPPQSKSQTIKAIFTKQINVLNQIMEHEIHDVTRRIINKEVWSQGKGENGKVAVYVRTTDETQADIVDMSEDSEHHMFECIYQEVPRTPYPPTNMGVGSTVVCYVYPFRVDIPLPQTPNIENIYGRAYGLHASNTVQLFRS